MQAHTAEHNNVGDHHNSAEHGRADSPANSGAAAISGEGSDSHGEVGSKQLGASAANNQTRGIYPAHPTTFTIECLDEYGKISQRHELLLELPDMSISAHYISWVLEGQLGACQH